jgi:tripartite-type tricarboxylate transporter receptor subunit TctC
VDRCRGCWSDLKEFTLDSWFALYAPAGTPKDVVQQLSTELAKILSSPDVKKKAEDAGTAVDYMGPAQLGEYTRKELAYWGRVIQGAKITAD